AVRRVCAHLIATLTLVACGETYLDGILVPADSNRPTADARAPCGPGEVICADRCTTLASDHDDCGACDKHCAPVQVCSLGTCAKSCTPGLVACDGGCVDLGSDRKNCGACGVTCATGESCIGGTCSCPPDKTLCGSACASLSTDPAHCGACGRACAASL